jgi:asparagine synthase (glutamine-hydrolysing)
MFLIQAEIINENMSSGKDNLPEGFSSIIKNNLKITFKKDRLYSFYVDCDDTVAIGESQIPIDIKSVRTKLESSNPVTKLLYSDNSMVHSLIIVDSRKKTITLAESIACCRPLYYQVKKGKITCSSHIKLMSESGIKLEPNNDAFPEICIYRYVVPPQTIYSGIKKVAGGSTLTFELISAKEINSEQRQLRSGYDNSLANDSDIISRIENQMSGNLFALCSNSSQPGILLSGGLDSSLLAALIKSSGQAINSVSSSFAFINKNDQEDNYAKSVADYLEIDHKIFSATEESYLTGLIDSIHAAEEPVHHLQSVMFYLLFQKYGDSNNDMFLCGEGADGLFGNDMHLKYFKHQSLIQFAGRTGLHGLFRSLFGKVFRDNPRFKLFTYYLGDDLNNQDHLLWSLGGYGDSDIVKKIFQADDSNFITSRIELMRHYQNLGMLDRITAISLLSEGYETMTIWSKLAESHGIKMAYPFTSPGLIDIASAIPWKIKLSESKHLIRSMLRNQNIPEQFITRPKLSFGFPVKYWGVDGGLFQPIVDMASDIFDKKMFSSILGENPVHAMILWSLLNIYIWHKLFIDEITVDDLKGEILRRHRQQ